jgi:hypothetical protein
MQSSPELILRGGKGDTVAHLRLHPVPRAEEDPDKEWFIQAQHKQGQLKMAMISHVILVY